MKVVALAGGIGVVKAFPAGEGLPPDNFRPGETFAEERPVPMTPAMRRAINSTLDRFVPAAIDRRDPALAWKLAGPGLRAGTTRRDWLRGDLPVHPYSFRGTSFHGWQLVYAHRDRVAVDLLLQPRRGSRQGPIVFGVDLVRRGPRWLVDSMYPAAVFSGADERPWVTGPADYRAGASRAKSHYSRKPDEARLSAVWLAVPGVLFASLLLIPIGFVVYNVAADRRARRAYAESSAAR